MISVGGAHAILAATKALANLRGRINDKPFSQLNYFLPPSPFVLDGVAALLSVLSLEVE